MLCYVITKILFFTLSALCLSLEWITVGLGNPVFPKATHFYVQHSLRCFPQSLENQEVVPLAAENLGSMKIMKGARKEKEGKKGKRRRKRSRKKRRKRKQKKRVLKMY